MLNGWPICSANANASSLLRITEQPMDLRTYHAGADAGIVPAIEPVVETVPTGIIELATCRDMLARRCRSTSSDGSEGCSALFSNPLEYKNQNLF